MSYQTIWYKTKLPKYVIDSFIEETENINVSQSTIKDNILNVRTRNSKTCWIQQSHWIGGFANHYVMQANQFNFGYDLVKTPDRPLQYTSYDEGEFYNWHVDTIDEVETANTSFLTIGPEPSPPPTTNKSVVLLSVFKTPTTV